MTYAMRVGAAVAALVLTSCASGEAAVETADSTTPAAPTTTSATPPPPATEPTPSAGSAHLVFLNEYVVEDQEGYRYTVSSGLDIAGWTSDISNEPPGFTSLVPSGGAAVNVNNVTPGRNAPDPNLYGQFMIGGLYPADSAFCRYLVNHEITPEVQLTGPVSQPVCSLVFVLRDPTLPTLVRIPEDQAEQITQDLMKPIAVFSGFEAPSENNVNVFTAPDTGADCLFAQPIQYGNFYRVLDSEPATISC